MLLPAQQTLKPSLLEIVVAGEGFGDAPFLHHGAIGNSRRSEAKIVQGQDRLLYPMSTVDYPPVYDDLVELLAKSANADEVLSFQLSNEKQTAA